MRKKKGKRAPKARQDTSTKAKKVVKKKAKKSRVEKTKNSGTMSTQAFWNMIRALLRRRSIYWLPILQTKNDAKIDYKGPNKRRKFSYICEECKGEFSSNEVNVHHIEECGSLTCAADAGGFIERLFCEKENLILLCQGCHDRKHSQ